MADQRRSGSIDEVVEALLFLYTEGRRLASEVASRYGLTAQQLAALKILDDLKGLKVSDLSERIRLNNSTVTGIIDRMERDGLVVRERGEDDRRVVRVALTEKGEALAHQIPISPMDSLRRAVEGLSRDEKRALLRLLKRIGENIRRTYLGEPAPAEPAALTSEASR